jgi:predicted regulator of Ras-like GTPase activity (Roadblock/LC7/MglB family)
MDDIKEKLERLESVDGFIAAGAVDAEGALIDQTLSVKEVPLNEICDIAGEVLKKTQKLSNAIGIGKTRFIHITLSEGSILSQSLGKHSDGLAPKVDRIVLFLCSKGNTALGKLRVNSLVKEISGNLRDLF